jgi:hypothetical protein
MIRNLKALGLSLVALFAVGALSAPAASAVDVFTVEGGGTALLTGTSHNIEWKYYNVSNVNFRCTTSKFAATIVNGASETTVDVTYSGTIGVSPHTTHCNTNAGGTLTIDTTGCGYIWTGNTDAPFYTNDAVKDATTWIHCEGTNQIKITSSLGPTITIPPQTPTAGGVTYTNVANGDVTVTTTVTGITATCHPTFSCTLAGIPHHTNNREYTGSVTMAGFVDNNPTPQITPAGEGPAKNISFS